MCAPPEGSGDGASLAGTTVTIGVADGGFVIYVVLIISSRFFVRVPSATKVSLYLDEVKRF
jgi:hypothetical protein